MSIDEKQEIQLFQINDKVFDVRYGWGKVCGVAGYTINEKIIIIQTTVWKFERRNGFVNYTTENERVKDSRYESLSFLSLTEYSLQGFSQRNIN